MLLFLIPILLLSSGVHSLNSYQPQLRSAATEAQIRFAIENKYDQTGPGAKGRELAYNTYKTLDEALVGYLDDPDTKLPEYERAKATQKLYSAQRPLYQRERVKPLYLNAPYNEKNFVYNDPNVDVRLLHTKEYHGNHLGYLKSLELERPRVDPLKYHKIQSVKGSPLNLAHFTRDPQEATEEFNPNPQYSYSYGVHDKLTGDSKSAHESREGGVVRGFYTFTDADGKQRTVQYTADDAQGFRAVVRRTASNGQ